LPGGCAAARRLLAPARRAPRLLQPRPSSAARGGAPRCPHTTASPTPHPGSARWGPRGLRSDGRPTRWADSSPHPKKSVPWAGDQIRRCRGWQISPEPAGTGRASRAGETAARLHANAEGPRRGSGCPVAGGGVCVRSGWGDARPHPGHRGTGKTRASRSEEEWPFLTVQVLVGSEEGLGPLQHQQARLRHLLDRPARPLAADP
jgi:hypothetical protein